MTNGWIVKALIYILWDGVSWWVTNSKDQEWRCPPKRRRRSRWANVAKNVPRIQMDPCLQDLPCVKMGKRKTRSNLRCLPQLPLPMLQELPQPRHLHLF